MSKTLTKVLIPMRTIAAIQETGIGSYFYHHKDSSKVCMILATELNEDLRKARYTVKFPWSMFSPGTNAEYGLDIAQATTAINSFMFGSPVELDDEFTEWINQAERYCRVIDIKKTRYRIEFEMPRCIQQGWRKGVMVCGVMYYNVNPISSVWNGNISYFYAHENHLLKGY